MEEPERALKASARAQGILEGNQMLPLRELLARPSQSRFPRRQDIRIPTRPLLQTRYRKRCAVCEDRKILSKCYRRGPALVFLTTAFLSQWAPSIKLRLIASGKPSPGIGPLPPLAERLPAVNASFKGYIEIVFENRRDSPVTVRVDAGRTALNRNNESLEEPFSNLATLKCVTPAFDFDLSAGVESDATMENTKQEWGVVARSPVSAVVRVPAEVRMNVEPGQPCRCCLPISLRFSDKLTVLLYPILTFGSLAI